MQDLCHQRIGKLFPYHLVVIRSVALMPGKKPALTAVFAHHSKRRAGALKCRKHQLETLPNLFVRVENAADRVISQSDWQAQLGLSTFGFVERTTPPTSPQQMQLCLTHRSFQTEQPPTGKKCRITKAGFSEDGRRSKGADPQPPMAGAGGAGQTGGLQAEHQSRSPQTDVSHQPLKPDAVRSGGS